VSLRAPPPTNTYKWSATSWGADGTLLGGIAEANFADAIGGTSGNDKTNGFGGTMRSAAMPVMTKSTAVWATT
jgi:hypothetical protein